MKTKIIFILIIFMSLPFTNVYGQSSQDIDNLKERAKEKTKTLNDYIAFMANPKKNDSTRYSYKKEAQTLFIQNCNPYIEKLEFRDGTKKDIIRKEGVTMEVTSVNRTSPRQKPMKEYFRGLINMTYKDVIIETTDIADMRVSKLQPYGKDKDGKQLYVCTVHFDQVFIGKRDNGLDYKDLTRKWVVCYVQIDQVLDEKTGETYPEYMVSLGDIFVESTERIF